MQPRLATVAVSIATLLSFAAAASAATFHRDLLVVPESAKVTVSAVDYPGLHNPNPRGWYYKCANVVLARDGSLVACWQLSDQHTSLTSWIMVARSTDGGRTWGGHRPIAHANVWEHRAIWVVPQMSVLRDGRIVIVCDRGQRTPGQNMPMLSDWQKPDRGMSNWLFWSSDHGRTWTEGEKVDSVGGEPGYVQELADGTLAFTRTSSKQTDQLKNPPAPWNDTYYRNEVVFSDDRGKTWPRTAWLADSPFHGDCEVGLAELAPGKLIAASRIGLGNGRFGHPSRLLYSDDNGRTWPRAHPAPFYGQRVHLGRLQSGKLLATYRNVWGTPGSRAVVLDPDEPLGFQPTSYILDETRCELTANALTLRTTTGRRGAVEFNLYPAQDDRARVEIEATLKIDEADPNGVAISAGCWVRFETNRISLGDRPAAGFAFDTRDWHPYRLRRESGEIVIWADGVEKLRERIDDIWVRQVRFGNRAVPRGGDSYSANRAVSHWRALSVEVRNDPRDHSIAWYWTPAKGYPDQFRRDRTVVLDHAYPASDCGYSSWTQRPDGRIVIVDYTNARHPADVATNEHPRNMIRAYLVCESDLVRGRREAEAFPGSTPVSNASPSLMVEWREIENLPDPAGRKGMYAGVSGGQVVLAGGSNFPVPQRAGGKKTFHRTAFVRPLPLSQHPRWISMGDALLGPLGEGASVTTSEGLVCLGGHDGEAPVSAAFLLRWEPQARRLEHQALPDLPAGNTNAAAADVDGLIYVAGGESAAGALATFWRLDLARAQADAGSTRWEPLPSWPGRPRMGCILVPVTTRRGGRLLLAGGVHGPARSAGDYLRDAFLYDPATRTWTAAAALPRPAVLPIAVAVDRARVIVMGGSDGHDFARMRELGERYRIPDDAFIYDADTDRWRPIARTPVGVVGAAVVALGDAWLIAGGEYSPGLRTPRVFELQIRRNGSPP